MSRYNSRRTTIKSSFVEKVWDMVKRRDLESIIRWGAAGTTFIVLSAKRMEEEVLSDYFKSRHLSSFVRQLNFYGFRKLPFQKSDSGERVWEFTHPRFHRGPGCTVETRKAIKRRVAGEALEAADEESSARLEARALRDETAALRKQLEAARAALHEAQQQMVVAREEADRARSEANMWRVWATQLQARAQVQLQFERGVRDASNESALSLARSDISAAAPMPEVLRRYRRITSQEATGAAYLTRDGEEEMEDDEDEDMLGGARAAAGAVTSTHGVHGLVRVPSASSQWATPAEPHVSSGAMPPAAHGFGAPRIPRTITETSNVSAESVLFGGELAGDDMSVVSGLLRVRSVGSEGWVMSMGSGDDLFVPPSTPAVRVPPHLSASSWLPHTLAVLQTVSDDAMLRDVLVEVLRRVSVGTVSASGVKMALEQLGEEEAARAVAAASKRLVQQRPQLVTPLPSASTTTVQALLQRLQDSVPGGDLHLLLASLLPVPRAAAALRPHLDSFMQLGAIVSALTASAASLVVGAGAGAGTSTGRGCPAEELNATGGLPHGARPQHV